MGYFLNNLCFGLNFCTILSVILIQESISTQIVLPLQSYYTAPNLTNMLTRKH